jgi:hypothetical protein
VTPRYPRDDDAAEEDNFFESSSSSLSRPGTIRSPKLGLGDKRPASTELDDDPKPPKKRRRNGPRLSDDFELLQHAASALHPKAWGKPWPQSKGTISKSGDEEDEDETGSVDALADKLEVPSTFDYWYFEEIRSLKSALGANSDQEEEDFLVVREEYELLRQALEGLALEGLKKRSFVVTGHPGIGSYESWF